MAPINPRLLVKTLTERRGRILLAFLFAGKAMDVNELATWTGKPRNAHYAELSALCADGLLARSSQKMAHGRDVYLLGADVLPLLQNLSGLLGAGRYLEEDATDYLLETGQMSERRTPGSVITVVPNPARIPEVQYQDPGVTFERNMAACRKARIGEPSATKVSLLEWVSPEFIRAHVDDLDPGDTIGLAILRITGNEIPRSWDEDAREIARKYYPESHPLHCDDDENESDGE